MKTNLLLALFIVLAVTSSAVTPASSQYNMEEPSSVAANSPHYPLFVPGTVYHSIALNTGKELTEVKVLDATIGGGVSIAVDKTIMSVPFNNLPAEIAIPASAYAKKKAYALSDRQVLAKSVEAHQKEELEKMYAANLKAAAELKAREEQAALLAEQTAKECRDGLRIASTSIDMASAYVTIQNTSASDQTFNWRKMKGKFRDGRVVDATACMASDKNFGYVVPAFMTRRFNMGFGARRIGDGAWLTDLSWAEGTWYKENKATSP